MLDKKLENILNDSDDLAVLSYSRMSDFDRNGPIALDKRKEVENKGIKHGSLVDVLIYDLLHKTETFDEEFIIADIVAPTATTLKLAKIILDNYIVPLTDSEMLEICRDNRFWASSKDETVIEKFTTEFKDYIKIMMKANNKKIVTTEEYILAKDAANTLLYHEYTHNLFFNDLENHYQVYFEFNKGRFKFRGYIDKLTIDHDKKLVYIEDIKTGEGKASKFMKSFLDYRYYLQEAVYCQSFNYIRKKFKIPKGYKLAPFKFIYLGKFEQTPIVWTVSEKWHNAALDGFITNGGYHFRGFNELLSEIEYHVQTGQFEHPRNVIENKGVLELESNFITVYDKS